MLGRDWSRFAIFVSVESVFTWYYQEPDEAEEDESNPIEDMMDDDSRWSSTDWLQGEEL